MDCRSSGPIPILLHSEHGPLLASAARSTQIHPEAAQRSERLRARMAQVIREAGGWIGFDRFMQMALYEPELGYYDGNVQKFGSTGDFVTAPEISPLFGRSIAHQVADVLRITAGDVLELGPGTGTLAVDILEELASMDVLPGHYFMLDVSGALRARQRERVAMALPQFIDRVHWLDTLPDRFHGVVIANEVLDALPVRLVSWREDGAKERGVVVDRAGFAFRDQPIADPALQSKVNSINANAPYLSEVHLQAEALVNTLAERLEQGLLLLIDYGFGRDEYYHPQRNRGTLLCHYNHHAHDDPFFMPGLQDITSHIEFSSVAQAGVDQGLALLGYTTQAHFLVNCGITDLLAANDASDAPSYLRLSSQAQKLLSPAEMGELFKVIALGKDLGTPLKGFVRGDLSRML